MGAIENVSTLNGRRTAAKDRDEMYGEEQRQDLLFTGGVHRV
jgi:hypothetical protein